MLSATGVSASYGGVSALHDVDVRVGEGQIVTVIGANGAGKSTLINTIMGHVRESRGSICFRDKELSHQSIHTRVRAGIALVPEGRRVFAPKSVWENLELGAFSVRGRKRDALIRDRADQVFTIFPRLQERREQAAGTLSGGEQQMLAIGRALMSGPRLLLLDEPSLGLAPLVVELILDTLGQLNKEHGLAMLLIEQNAAQALRRSDYAYVLVNGRVVQSGEANVLVNDPTVEQAYLGIGSTSAGPASTQER